VLGPQPAGKRRITAGMRGHRTFIETPGRRVYSILTSDGETSEVEFESSHPLLPRVCGALPRGRRRRPAVSAVAAPVARCLAAGSFAVAARLLPDDLVPRRLKQQAGSEDPA
jgi:hypothetical protein